MADDQTQSQDASQPSQSIDYSALAAEIGRQQRESQASSYPVVSGELIDPEDENIDPTNHGAVLDYFARKFPDSHPALQHRMKNGVIHRNFPELAYAIAGVPYGELADEQIWQRAVATATLHYQGLHRPDPALAIPVEPTQAEVLQNRVDQLEKMLRSMVNNGGQPALARG